MKNERTRHLKIKIINLADEARTIRAEERKVVSDYRAKHGDHNGDLPGSVHIPEVNSLHDHRVHTVRDAARSNLLAYAFLREVPYELVESPNTVKPIDWTRVRKIVEAFGGDPDLVADWYLGKALPLAAVG